MLKCLCECMSVCFGRVQLHNMRSFILFILVVGCWGDMVKVRPGMLFVNSSLMTFSSRSHTLVVEYDANVILSNLGLVESNIAQTETIVSRANTPLSSYFLKECREVSKIIRNSRSYLEDFLSTHRHMFPVRNKRSGGFNPLGFILNNLLGVATQEEISRLEDVLSTQSASISNYIVRSPLFLY